jgi:type IV secretion system protein VirB10
MPNRNACILSAAFCALIACGAAAAAEIPKGTHVLLRMQNSISTKTAHEGDYVYLRTASPITDAGRIAVPAGSYVQGVVTQAKRSGRVAGKAELGIRLETLTLTRGTVLKFSPRLSSVDSNGSEQKVAREEEDVVRQGSEHGRDTARVAIFAGSGAALGGIVDQAWRGAGVGAGIGGAVGLATVLATRGREVELRRGSTLDVVFDRPVILE